jgi:two-component system chemotaxis response regulator CheB
VVDDSATVRQAMTSILGRDGAIEVTTAADPVFALAKMERDRPDVIVTDIEMPRMDGLTFLRRIMARDPIPTIICSALTGTATNAAILALEEGAMSVVTKPKLGVKEFLEESAVMLIDAVRDAGAIRRGRLERRSPHRNLTSPVFRGRPVVKPVAPSAAAHTVIAIGASTGGTEALREILESMPADCPGIVIVQHMPEGFTRAFAERLDRTCRIEVKEAEDGDRVLQGRALIAPGNRHLRLQRGGAHYRVEVSDGPLVSRHRPSVDVLFCSAAKSAGRNAVGVLLTGMGDDGARGLLEMREASAPTIAQDEATCVVFGMPREAIVRGAVEDVVPLPEIGQRILFRSGFVPGRFQAATAAHS